MVLKNKPSHLKYCKALYILEILKSNIKTPIVKEISFLLFQEAVVLVGFILDKDELFNLI